MDLNGGFSATSEYRRDPLRVSMVSRNQLGTPVNPNLSECWTHRNLSEWWTQITSYHHIQVSPLWLFHLSVQQPQKTSTNPLKNSFVEKGIWDFPLMDDGIPQHIGWYSPCEKIISQPSSISYIIISLIYPQYVDYQLYIPWRIHGAGIYANMDPINIPHFC